MRFGHIFIETMKIIASATLLGILLICPGARTVRAQTAQCTLTGHLFNTNLSPALDSQFVATQVERSGSSLIITPLVLSTDAMGAIAFVAPQGSTIWLAASALGSSAPGDVAIQIPSAPSADLNILAITAHSPISGVSISGGSNPVMSLSLPDFGINLTGVVPVSPVQSVNGRTGAVVLTAADVTDAFASAPGVLPPWMPVGGGLMYSNGNAVTSIASASAGKLLTATEASGLPEWTATPVLAVGDTGNSTFLQARLTDHGAVGHYNFAVGRAENPGDPTRSDHVLTIGYNTAPLGGRALASEPAFEWRIEDYYAPLLAGAGPFMEAHWQYYDSTGAGFRPLAMQIDRRPGKYFENSTVEITSSALSYTGMNGLQYLMFVAGQTRLLNGTYLDSFTNNQQFLRQAKANGSLYSLMWLNAKDELVVGNGLWKIPIGTGHLLTYGDNAYDIGSLTTNRPRTGYFGTSVVTPALQITAPLVPPGTADAATLGKVGGSGPQATTQSGWMQVIDSTGQVIWIPVWK